MDSGEMAARPERNGGGFDPDQDRYPDLAGVLSLIGDAEDYPEGPIEKVEIICHASGDATWRVWTPRAEEPVGGYYPPEATGAPTPDVG